MGVQVPPRPRYSYARQGGSDDELVSMTLLCSQLTSVAPRHNLVLAELGSTNRASPPSWCLAREALTLRCWTRVCDRVKVETAGIRHELRGWIKTEDPDDSTTSDARMPPPRHDTDATTSTAWFLDRLCYRLCDPLQRASHPSTTRITTSQPGPPSPLLSSSRRSPTRLHPTSALTKHPPWEPRVAAQGREAPLPMIPSTHAHVRSPTTLGHHGSCQKAMGPQRRSCNHEHH